MGKKHVIVKSKEELLKERDKIESSIKKEVNLNSSTRVRDGRIYLSCSYNNLIMTLTNSNGDVLFWSSAGKLGFKGAKKGTSFAASKVAEAMSFAIDKAKIKSVKIFVKGIGAGRVSALKSLAAKGLNIISVKDTTAIPHNGCRPKKARRL